MRSDRLFGAFIIYEINYLRKHLKEHRLQLILMFIQIIDDKSSLGLNEKVAFSVKLKT